MRWSKSVRTMTNDPSTLLLHGGRFTIPAGAEGRSLIKNLSFEVPRRSEGRTSAHRERFCFVALLNTLLVTDPDFFPATIVRSEAPDFVIFCPGDRVFGVEHTDAGEPEYQRHLSETEDSADPVCVPSPNDDGWRGDMPERAFSDALRSALSHMRPEVVWRNAPSAARRWLLTYDQTNTGMFVGNNSALEFLNAAALADRRWSEAYARIYLVRSQDVVLTCARQGSG